MDDDGFNLDRFLEAQEAAYQGALAELGQGKKVGHWMWFIFPQIQGLGESWVAMLYSIASLEEAKAYLSHPVLGSRLIECTRAVHGVDGVSAQDIFGFPDVLKFRSCLTLFAQAAPHEPVFANALAKYYDGEPCGRSLEILQSA